MKTDRKKLAAAVTGREWHIIKHAHYVYEVDCGVCSRYGVCRKHDRCNQTKGLIRNWKEFRLTQFKQK